MKPFPPDKTLDVARSCLCLHAQRAARALARHFDEVFRPFDLTNGQFSLLMALNRPAPATIGEVAQFLAMDRTTLTALIKPLERRGLLDVLPDAGDRRKKRVKLTGQGHALLGRAYPVWCNAHAQLEQSIENPDALRALLLQAAATGTPPGPAPMRQENPVPHLPDPAAVNVRMADPTSEDAQACLQAYFAELQDRFDEGFDPGLSVSADPEELIPPRGVFLLATRGETVVGCGALKIQDSGYGEIKRMWVASSARGQGVALQLLQALETHAMRAGVDVLRLDTHRNLEAARKLYQRHGYVEIPAYNDNPYAHYWFEKRGLQAPKAP